MNMIFNQDSSMKYFLIMAFCTHLTVEALAATANYELKTCLKKTSLAKVADSLKDYEKHRDIDDNMESDFKVFNARYVDMVRSTSTKIEDEATHSKYLVEYALKPMTLKNPETFPHFYLLCLTNSKDPLRFAQKCDLKKSMIINGEEKQLRRFGVDDFKLLIEAKERSESCPQGIALNLTIEVSTISKDVETIKMEMVRGTDVLKNVVDKIFVEETFLKNYYEKFYKAWRESL